MKKSTLINFLPVLVALTALADTQLDILKGIGLTDVAINYIKLIGLGLALITPKLQDAFKKGFITTTDELPDEPPVDDDGIGGGGIKNPPKP